MPRPLPFDLPSGNTSAPTSRPAPTSPPSLSPFNRSPSTPGSSPGAASLPASPFYGLEREAVALLFDRSNRDLSSSPDSTSRDPIRPFTTSNAPGSDRTRRYSASSLNPIRPPTRIRTPSPPPHPFDGNEGSTSAWLRWLGERRARRVEAEGGDRSRAAQSPNDPLRRLRQSAERLRTVESRLGQGTLARETAVEPPSEASEAYDESRRLLLEVRQRLEDTRTRIEDARALVNNSSSEENDDSDFRDSVVEARQGLDRTVAFASRLGQLASTLTDLSARASALTDSATASRLSELSPRSAPRSPAVRAPRTSTLESTSSASQTDSIRHTVRQLIVASRRVSAAIDRHRAQQEEAAASSSSQPTNVTPLPAIDVPLRVSFPSPLRSSTSSTPSERGLAPPDFAETTSPNPDGLLLPSRPLTRSPLALSADYSRTTGLQGSENYPGERAQLLRIASLQRDIASRALELRELRARGRELDREEREARRLRSEGSQNAQGTVVDPDKEEDESNYWDFSWTTRRPRREVEVEASSSGDETVMQSRVETREERRRRYQVYSICGR
ncbi:hypothetical protein JCM16303_001081 [Sporobolomyces ruberrimus]